ncbi:PilZ domain-containing protein [Maridesulfovibrio ferrireducens]|uniref:PilZ domain-containing protein n=1 Tax=Maridesulfovibrio ferrireducens TaxID=246191 RepID=UPI001A246AEA|nr:PilZ domain-containing protein [Maridesulfovibrio ferrireducens]MBI9109853.1 PilZ domain-containing protein [Maridesulfovibrio ferrireducens]
MEQNKRRRTRIDVEFTVQLNKNGFSAIAETQNLSLKGILCTGVEGFAVGEKCEVLITLSEEIVIRIEGKVVRSDDSGLAVDFILLDEESFTHLHRVIQYNSTDADVIDGELTLPAFDA